MDDINLENSSNDENFESEQEVKSIPVQHHTSKQQSDNILNKYLPYCVAGLLGLFALLMHFFLLVGVKASFFGNTLSVKVSGFTLLGGRLSSFGYTESIPAIWVIIGWLMFLVSLCTFAYAIIFIINNFLKKDILHIVKVGSSLKRIIIASLANSFVYMIIGIIYSSSSGDVGFGDVYTAAFWPLIIDILILAGFFVLRKFAPQIADNVPIVRQTEEKPIINKEKASAGILKKKTDVVEEIKRYKELLDMGAITQEEYDAKKAEFLNK